MKKLVFGAAALTAASAAFANESDWAQLDQDIQALSASMQGVETGGVNVNGRIRAAYENSGDIVGSDADGNLMTTDDQNDLGGFALYNARLYSSGKTAKGIGYHVELDFAPTNNALSTGPLLDAFLDIPVGGEITIRAGQFRAHVLRESLIDSGDLMFFDRSIPASIFSGRSTGVAALGKFDTFNWAVTVQNGGDSVGDELFYALRGSVDVLGKGTGLVEGAYGVTDADMVASVGASYFNDDAVEDADGFALEGSLATQQFSANATIVSVGDGISLANAENNERMAYAIIPSVDATIFSVGGSVMLTQAGSDYGAWELGARFQDLDNAADTTVLDVGANYYADGHNMKYIINFTSVSADAGFDGTLIRVGVQTRF